MRKPNFFIIGAPKCGTTSMWAWLSEHPNVYMSAVKEPQFYSSDLDMSSVPSAQKYEQLFRGANDQHIAVGEASTSYLYSQVAVLRIEREHPGAKYIVMVRNPVEMARSLHEQWLFSGHEHIRDFETAWRLTPERRRPRRLTRRRREPRWRQRHYQSLCRLGEQLERLFAVVPRERVLVLVLDDVRQNPRREYLRVLDFLGVPDDGRREFPVHNPAREHRWPALGTAIRGVGIVARLVKRGLGIPTYKGTGVLNAIDGFNARYRPRAPMAAHLRRELVDYFWTDVEKLSRLMGRDFSPWLSFSADVME